MLREDRSGHVVRRDDVDVRGPGVHGSGERVVRLHDGVTGLTHVLIEIVLQDG
jgi:hypothetical protein